MWVQRPAVLARRPAEQIHMVPVRGERTVLILFGAHTFENRIENRDELDSNEFTGLILS